MYEILSAHIHPIQIEERYPLVLEKINQILNQWLMAFNELNSVEQRV